MLENKIKLGLVHLSDRPHWKVRICCGMVFLRKKKIEKSEDVVEFVVYVKKTFNNIFWLFNWVFYVNNPIQQHILTFQLVFLRKKHPFNNIFWLFNWVFYVNNPIQQHNYCDFPIGFVYVNNTHSTTSSDFSIGCFT